MCSAIFSERLRDRLFSSGQATIGMAMLLCTAFTVAAGPRVVEEQAQVLMPGPSDQLPSGLGTAGDYMVVATRRNFTEPDGFFAETFAYLFQRMSDTGQWHYVSTLAQNRTEWAEAITYSVAMQGNLAVVKTDLLNVYEYTPATGWSRTAQLASSGATVRVDAGTIFSGGPGCAWEAFRKNSASQWIRVGGVDDPQLGDCFFSSNDISGSTVVVGNPLAGTFEPTPSEIRVYSGFGSTTPDSTILSPFGNDATFGAQTAIEGPGLITVSFRRPGIQVFSRNAAGEWNFLSTAAPADALMDPQNLNVPVLEMSNDLAVGAYPFDPHRAEAAGSIPVFRRNSSGTLSEVARLLASDARAGMQLGTYLAINGSRIAAATANSAVYVFELPSDLSQPPSIQEDFQSGSAGQWTPIVGSSFSVVSARGSRVYRQTSLNAGAGSHVSNMDWQDQSIQTDVRPTAFDGADRWFGLVVRGTDANNYYYVTARSSNVIELKRMVNGTFETLASAPLHVQLNRNYRLRLEAVGTWIRAYVDGKLAVQAQDGSLTHGQAGLQMYKARADYDNVVVTPNPLRGILNDDFNLGIITRWSPVDGQWNVVVDESANGATYRQSSLAGGARSVTGVRTGDQVVQANARALNFAGKDVWLGLMARYVDNRNYYYLTLRSNGTLSLRKLANDSIFVLGTTALTVTPNAWYNLRLEAIGSSLRAYVNGELRLEARDAAFPTGRYGLVTYRTAADFDELLVSQP